MQGRAFLAVARMVVAGTTEAFWRAAAVDAYYALMLEARDALVRWGLPIPPRHNVHSYVRLRFTYAGEPNLKEIGKALDEMVRLRNYASYDLSALVQFASAAKALDTIQGAGDAIALLDAIEADAQRLARAIASFPP